MKPQNMRLGPSAPILIGLFGLIVTDTAIAQSRADQQLGARISGLGNVEAFLLSESRRQRQELAAARAKNKDLPTAIPKSLRQPWVYEASGPRRQKQATQTPQQRRVEIAKIRAAGRDDPDFAGNRTTYWFAGVAMDHAQTREVQTKFGWLQDLNRGFDRQAAKVKGLKGTARQVAAKQLTMEVELAERIACILVGCGTRATSPKPTRGKKSARKKPDWADYKPRLPTSRELTAARSGSATPRPKPVLKKITGFSSGLLYQMGLHYERLEDASHDRTLTRILSRARQSFGDGKAGGGGVSLHLPATVAGGLDPGSVRRAVVEKGRLVLLLKEGKRVRMPKLPLDDLAVAMRTIFGPHRLVTGTLSALDGEAIAVKTGKSKFGEVVWRRSNLPAPWQPVKIGSKTALAISPAIGLLDLPEPSLGRITFYGNMQNTRLGSIMSRADQLLLRLAGGVDPATGRMFKPPPIPGYMNLQVTGALDMAGLLKLRKTPKPKNIPPPKPGNWWRNSVWFNWVSAAVRLDYLPAAGTISVRRSGIRLDTWISRGNVPAAAARLAKWVNDNIGALTKTYPVLAELKSVATTVAIVRWLKVNGIATDTKWATSRKVKTVPTPERVPQTHVFLIRNSKGQPIFRKSRK